ncbi:5'/3'-nucleotidase SurE [Lignipirellula cremea]|uniref:5'-nucleotidase n=1 Tax=Lignipirellula cremea TaxID=2528010 RepID=A0A518DW34_9BACT|nr:5'/3'-nucleotidase SurE [Lignipirellula cremea]QDU96047.1 5'-nucleotidase SurE [Lignipirellula cremea]
MKILITNDDGIDAAGIASLYAAALPLGEVTVAAPARPFSGCGHQTTTHETIAVSEIRPGWFRIDGTPADCVRIALRELAADADYVLSGINEGANLGVDIYMSGTVAAAREAAFFGKPALAISQFRERGAERRWSHSERLSALVLQRLLPVKISAGRFWNVNLPDNLNDDQAAEAMAVEQMVVTHVERAPLPVEFIRTPDGFRYSGLYHERLRSTGSDVDACFSGKIALTLLGEDLED